MKQLLCKSLQFGLKCPEWRGFILNALSRLSPLDFHFVKVMGVTEHVKLHLHIHTGFYRNPAARETSCPEGPQCGTDWLGWLPVSNWRTKASACVPDRAMYSMDKHRWVWDLLVRYWVRYWCAKLLNRLCRPLTAKLGLCYCTGETGSDWK